VAAAAPALRIEPLSERHERESFASGVAPLDRYLRQQAAQDTRRRVATCFVLVGNDEHVPIGYYTFTVTGMALAELPKALAKRLPRFPMVPATLMGRLAVDARHQRHGHGEFMLLDAFGRALRNEIASYAVRRRCQRRQRGTVLSVLRLSISHRGHPKALHVYE